MKLRRKLANVLFADLQWSCTVCALQVKKSVHTKILLVDDEVAVRNSYQLFLERHGYGVVSASSVSEALRILTHERISLAIIDIFLDEDNGLDLLKGIMSARPGLPVIMMSGYGSEELFVQEALASGARAFFPKPVSTKQLLAEIRKTLLAVAAPVSDRARE
jgi:DNA-binding NtrC family response regulator